MADDLVGMDPGMDESAAIGELAKAIAPEKWEGTLGKLLKATLFVLQPVVGEETAEQLAAEIVCSQAGEVGGGLLYFPTDDKMRRALRDAKMAELYYDQNWSITRLRQRYAMTDQNVYAILARQKAIRRRAEPDLFGFGEGEKG